MGKKRSRATKTSKGQRPNVSSGLTLAVAQSVHPIDKMLHKIDAWLEGRNPWITIEDSNGPADRRFRKVRANDLWGSHKAPGPNIYAIKRPR